MKTTEEIIKEWLKSQEYTGVYIGYEEGDDLDSVSIDGYVDLESLVEAAKAERDEHWKEKIKEATRFRMACTCLKPNCEKDGWNSAMESVERNLLSPNQKEDE